MKLLSFNLDPFRLEHLDAIGKIVRAKRPEFIAFQNVTNDNIKKIKATPWGARYNVIQPTSIYETRLKPTLALFSTYPVISEPPLVPVTIDYDDTETDRFMQKAYYEMFDRNNKPFVICIATTSLEKDLKATEMREKQLNQACSYLKNAEDAFLVGNFCLDHDIDGDLVFKGGWVDAWLSISGNTEFNGCTYDPDKNPLIKDDQFGPRRPDRLFYKSRHFQLDHMEIVGVEPLQGPGGSTTSISKNFGLFAHLTALDRAKDKIEPPRVAVHFQRPEWTVKLQENSNQ